MKDCLPEKIRVIEMHAILLIELATLLAWLRASFAVTEKGFPQRVPSSYAFNLLQPRQKQESLGCGLFRSETHLVVQGILSSV